MECEKDLGQAYGMKRRKKMAEGGYIKAEQPNQVNSSTKLDGPQKKEDKGLLSSFGLAKGGEVSNNPKLEQASKGSGSHKFYIDSEAMADEIMKKRKGMAKGGMVDDHFDDDDMEEWSMSHDDLFSVDDEAPTPSKGESIGMDGFDDEDQQKKKRKSMISSIMAQMRATDHYGS